MTVNVAPSQVMPNIYSVNRVFETICQWLGVFPNIGVFLTYYGIKISSKWLGDLMFLSKKKVIQVPHKILQRLDEQVREGQRVRLYLNGHGLGD